MTNQQRGLAPLIIVAIVAVTLAIAGIGGYFGYQAVKKSKTADSPAAGESVVEPATEEVEDGLPVLYGEVDISGAGLPAGELPSFAASGDFDLTTADFDFSGLGGFELDVSGPTDSTLTAPPVPNLTPTDFDFSGVAGQMVAQQQQQQQAPPENQTPTEPPSSEPPPEPPAQSQVNASNCAQFASMPSASYCSAVGDPNGRQLCQDCKAASY